LLIVTAEHIKMIVVHTMDLTEVIVGVTGPKDGTHSIEI
jgi:hypothetical protein